MADLTTIFHPLQRQLFPALAAELGPLSALDQQFCEVLSLTDLGRFTRRYEWCGNGAPSCPRTWLAQAFSAQRADQFPPTGALLDALQSRPLLRQLCGWDSAGEIPSEPTFSRAFAAFAQDPVPQQIHEQRVKTHAEPKRVGHVSRDATAIEAPERPAAKPAVAAPAAPRKRGRSQRGEECVRPGRPSAGNSKGRARWPGIWPTCPRAMPWVASATARATRKVGSVTSSIGTPGTGISRSAPG